MSAPALLVISPDFPPARGGIQILSHRIAGAMRQFDTTVLTIDHDGASEFDSAEALVIQRSSRARGRRALSMPLLNVQGIRYVLKYRPDAVLSTHIVVSPAAAAAQRLWGIPFLQYVHAKEVGVRPRLARVALSRADRVVAVSRYSSDLAQSHGARPETIRLIHPGVDVPERQAAQRSRRPTILTISRLEDRYKGHDVMLRALPLVRAQIPDVTWRIIGAGPLRTSLVDRARALNLGDAVRFLGGVSDEERDAELARAHVFCMVSRLPPAGFAGEGFGIVYLEANAHGLPVVAGRVAGALDAVRDEETGLLVDPENHVELAGSLIRLLRDKWLAERLASRGRSWARELTWERASREVETELLAMLAHRQGSPVAHRRP